MLCNLYAHCLFIFPERRYFQTVAVIVFDGPRFIHIYDVHCLFVTFCIGPLRLIFHIVTLPLYGIIISHNHFE